MLHRNWVRSFSIRLAIVYLLLVIPWPGVEKGFSAFYRGTANALIDIVDVGSYLRMNQPAAIHPHDDVELRTSNPQTGAGLRIGYGSRDWGFLPLAAGLALTLAVPPPWPKRIRYGLLVMGLIAVFVVLRIAVAGIYGLSTVGVFTFGRAGIKAMGSLVMGFSATPVTSFVVPVIFWLLVTYRSFDFGQRTTSNGQTGSPSTAGEEP